MSLDPDELDETIRRLLRELSNGSESAGSELIELVYAELYRIAQRFAGHRTPTATELVSEFYLKLARHLPNHAIHDKRHLMRVAARAMRQIISDEARARRAGNRPDENRRVEFEDLLSVFEQRARGLADLDVALEQLGEVSPDAVEVIELRFFGGLTMSQASDALGISRRQADRLWAFARAWLRDRMQELDGED